VFTVIAEAAVTIATPPPLAAVNSPAVAVVRDALAPLIRTVETTYLVIPAGRVIVIAVSVFPALKSTVVETVLKLPTG